MAENRLRWNFDMKTYRKCKIRWWTACHRFWLISIWKHIEIAKFGESAAGTSFRWKSISNIIEMSEISDLDRPSPISLKNQWKIIEIATAKTGIAPTTIRWKTLVKSSKWTKYRQAGNVHRQPRISMKNLRNFIEMTQNQNPDHAIAIRWKTIG